MLQREGENQNDIYLANWPVCELSEVVVQLEVMMWYVVVYSQPGDGSFQ